MKSMGGEYSTTRWRKLGDEAAVRRPDAVPEVRLAGDDWNAHVSNLALRFGGSPEALRRHRPSALEESPESFHVGTVVAQDRGSVTTAEVAASPTAEELLPH